MKIEANPSILVVDDIRENLILLDHIIQPLEVDIIMAQSGEEALQKIEGTRLFLALIDVKMPVMDGIELAGRLQQHPDHKTTPVIFITAFADKDIVQDCYRAGAVDFISKPFQQYILLCKIKVFLDLHHQNIQLRKNQLKLEEATQELEAINKSLLASQEELAGLTAHLEDIREDERKKIALDLHDDLGQRLTALLMDLAWLRNNLEPDHTGLTAKVNMMKTSLEDTINTVRRISMGLRPSALDDLGLEAALKWLFADYTNNTGIPVAHNLFTDEIEIDSRLSILIYRLTQEILTNVVRHANADRVDFSLKLESDHLLLSATDNGVGISKEKMAKPNAFGLRGMKERVISWGGTINIEGKPMEGTRVVVVLPLSKNRI
jgi:signal transduction histidine kinase